VIRWQRNRLHLELEKGWRLLEEARDGLVEGEPASELGEEGVGYRISQRGKDPAEAGVDEEVECCQLGHIRDGSGEETVESGGDMCAGIDGDVEGPDILCDVFI